MAFNDDADAVIDIMRALNFQSAQPVMLLIYTYVTIRPTLFLLALERYRRAKENIKLKLSQYFTADCLV